MFSGGQKSVHVVAVHPLGFAVDVAAEDAFEPAIGGGE